MKALIAAIAIAALLGATGTGGASASGDGASLRAGAQAVAPSRM